MKKFSDFHLPKALADSLEQMQFDTPTPIQEQAIPHALDGRDILGSAQTGTGKTAAFMIPVLAKLLTDETAQALVMSPTRELATQIMDMTRKLMGHKSGIRTALLIGGEPMFKQFKQLSARPRLIIGTPGRIDDHCRRNKSLLDTTHTLVLDEADRMLDMGFSVQIDSILKYMPAEKHTLMFSATFSDKIIKFAQRYLNNPVRVAVKAEKITADKIKHDVVQVRSREDKYTQLLGELEARQGSVIIFVKTRRNADQLSKKLCDTGNENFRAEPIHGDLRQRQRDRTIKSFHSKQFRILVATDVASRGLDIPHIEHVINFDLPQNPEDYIHRIGRTARAGAEGQAMCFVTPAEGRDWAIIQRIVFPHMAPPQNDNRGSKGGDFKKSYAGKGRPKPSFRSDNGAQGNRSDRPRSDRPRQWENREKPANRDARPEKRDDRFEGSERPKKKFGHSENRSSDNRSEGRPEGRFNSRPDNRSENRSDRPARSEEGRSENRYKPRERGDRPEGKFGARTDNRDGARDGNRDKNRSDNRPDNRGNRFETRSDSRPDDRGNRVERQDGRPDDRGNRFKKREGERSEFRGGDAPAKRRPHGENRNDGSAAKSDNRTDRSQGFKKSEGRTHDGQKHEGARKEGARKPDGGFKKSGGFAGKKKSGFSKQTGSFKRAG